LPAGVRSNKQPKQCYGRDREGSEGAFGQKRRKSAYRKLRDWIVRVVGLFDNEVRGQLFELGKVRQRSSAKAEKDLGWSSRAVEETIVDTATSLETQGALI
jgi:hypothetical protein